MENISPENIQRLIKEALEICKPQDIYNAALSHLDLKKMQEEQPLSREALLTNVAVGGFIVGLQFALENLEARPEEEDTV